MDATQCKHDALACNCRQHSSWKFLTHIQKVCVDVNTRLLPVGFYRALRRCMGEFTLYYTAISSNFMIKITSVAFKDRVHTSTPTNFHC